MCNWGTAPPSSQCFMRFFALNWSFLRKIPQPNHHVRFLREGFLIQNLPVWTQHLYYRVKIHDTAPQMVGNCAGGHDVTPTQTNAFWRANPPKNYHRLALWKIPPIFRWHLMTPVWMLVVHSKKRMAGVATYDPAPLASVAWQMVMLIQGRFV